MACNSRAQPLLISPRQAAFQTNCSLGLYFMSYMPWIVLWVTTLFDIGALARPCFFCSFLIYSLRSSWSDFTTCHLTCLTVWGDTSNSSSTLLCFMSSNWPCLFVISHLLSTSLTDLTIKNSWLLFLISTFSKMNIAYRVHPASASDFIPSAEAH